MTDYKPIAAQLGRVRRAWKRTAALAGLAVTVLEAAGMLAVLVLADLLFRPGVQGRLALMALLLGAVGTLLVRHVLRPLFRRIPDSQVALYVEEHNPGFEGALIAAAEFGRQAPAEGRAEIVATILAEAERRAAHFDARSVTRLLRLRKYAWSAASVVAAYGLASLVFPQTVGRHAVRVIAPWRAPNTQQAVGFVAAVPVKPDIAFALSSTNADVLRGAAFRIEAALSRDPDATVQIHFRSCGESASSSRWYAAAMKSVEKVRTYEGVLPDVNEDMECYVSAERFRSSACRLRVYDPLAVEALETVIHYPAYLELPDRVERRPTGDVAAPEGAQVTLRVLANRPLQAGELAWTDGPAQPLSPVAGESNVAAAVFTVTTNRAYRFRISDAMRQVVESPAEAYVKVLPDNPPTITLRRPVTPPESVTPLSAFTVAAGVADDFGVAGVDLVYRCGAETEGPEQRVPLALSNRIAETESPVSILFSMPAVRPPLAGGEVIAWHLEARDRKNQTATTDLILTPVRYLDVWSTENWESPEEHHVEEEPPSLAAILQDAFHLAARRALLAPRECDQQTDDLAQTMVNARTKAVWTFVKVKHGTPPADVPKIKMVNALAAKGHAALVAHQLDPAVDELRHAVMLMIAMGLLEDMKLVREPPSASAAQADANQQLMNQQMQAMAALEQQAAQTHNADKDHKLEQADKSADAQKKLAELAQEQKKHADQADAMARKEADAAAKGTPPPDQQGARQQAANAQQALAETVKQAANAMDHEQGLDAAQRERTGEALRNAARHMDNAAHEMQTGRLEKAAREAAEAHTQLATARNEIAVTGLEKLAETLAKAEQQAGQARHQQQEIAKATAAAAAAPQTARNAPQMQVLAAQQARVKTDLDGLQETVNALKQAVERGEVRPETAAHIQAAEQELRHGRAPQKAASAAVALAAQRPEDAAPEQQAVAATLEKAHAHLQQASDGMAAGYEAELKRAQAEARQAAQKIAGLQQPQPAADAAEHQARTADALETAGRLAHHVAARDFVTPPTLQGLQQQLQQAQSGGGRVEEEKKAAIALAAAVQRVHEELDVAAERLQASKKLFSSQREECPPQYRPLVNTYFEKLSEGKP